MKVTILSVNGDPSVHKAGCAHLNRLRSDVKYDAEVATAQEAANDFWSDFLKSGEMTESEALGYTFFAPCVKTLK